VPSSTTAQGKEILLKLKMRPKKTAEEVEDEAALLVAVEIKAMAERVLAR